MSFKSNKTPLYTITTNEKLGSASPGFWNYRPIGAQELLDLSEAKCPCVILFESLDGLRAAASVEGEGVKSELRRIVKNTDLEAGPVVALVGDLERLWRRNPPAQFVYLPEKVPLSVFPPLWQVHELAIVTPRGDALPRSLVAVPAGRLQLLRPRLAEIAAAKAEAAQLEAKRIKAEQRQAAAAEALRALLTEQLAEMRRKAEKAEATAARSARRKSPRAGQRKAEADTLWRGVAFLEAELADLSHGNGSVEVDHFR